MHLLTSGWMTEPDFGSMQPETVALGAVEFVANDGAAQPVGVGTVDAQLVGAPRLGPKGNECPTLGLACRGDGAQYLVVGDSPLAVFQVYHLSRTVHGVWPQGQGDASL